MKYGPNCPHRNASSPVSAELVIIVTGPNRKNFLWLAPKKEKEIVLENLKISKPLIFLPELDSMKCPRISSGAFCANCVQGDG